MKNFLLLVVLLSTLLASAISISCCAGRAGCVVSCNAQNCATGSCTRDGCSGVCKCSRCGQGSVAQGASVGIPGRGRGPGRKPGKDDKKDERKM